MKGTKGRVVGMPILSSLHPFISLSLKSLPASNER